MYLLLWKPPLLSPVPFPSPSAAPPCGLRTLPYPQVRADSGNARCCQEPNPQKKKRNSDRLAVFAAFDLVLTCIETNPHRSRFASLDPQRRHRAASLQTHRGIALLPTPEHLNFVLSIPYIPSSNTLIPSTRPCLIPASALRSLCPALTLPG
jgi:hypothetical protein